MTFVVESHRNGSGRGIGIYVGDASNDANRIGDNFTPDAQTTRTWENWTLPEGVVDEDGDGLVDIVVKNTSGCHIYSIEIGSKQNTPDPSGEKYKYVINFIDQDGNFLTSTSDEAVEGTRVEIPESVWANQVKYFPIADDSEDNLVSADNKTEVTVICRMAEKYTYSVVAISGSSTLSTLVKGSNYEGEAVDVPYPRYINFNSKLFKKEATDSKYLLTLTLDANKELKLEYLDAGIDNMLFFSEAEDVKALTVVTSGDAVSSCSNMAAAYASDDVKIIKLAPGTYTITAAAFGGEMLFKAGTSEVFFMEATEGWSEATSASFTLTEATDLFFKGGLGEDAALDYVFLESANGGIVSELSRWDFTNFSTTTVANLIADAEMGDESGWSDQEYLGSSTPVDNRCFWYHSDTDFGTVKANGEVIAELNGLYFPEEYCNKRNLAIAVDYASTSIGTYHGPQYLWLGIAGTVCFVIPDVKAGTEIKMAVESHRNGSARGVQLFTNNGTLTNIVKGTELKDPKGNAVPVPDAYTEQTWLVPEDAGTVDILVYNTSGCHVYYVEAVQETSSVINSISEVNAHISLPEGIYNISGTRQTKLSKGINIIVTPDGNVKKVLVK